MPEQLARGATAARYAEDAEAAALTDVAVHEAGSFAFWSLPTLGTKAYLDAREPLQRAEPGAFVEGSSRLSARGLEALASALEENVHVLRSKR